MSTTPAQIDLWRGVASEHQRLEFKEAKLQFDNNKLYRYCVALANEGGAYQAGRKGRYVQKVRPVPAVLGMSLFKRELHGRLDSR